MSRIFRYILGRDTGMAPCIADDLTSLATCKPQIRIHARPGNWVLGFYPGSAFRGLLAWAGCVSRSIEVGHYEKEFRGRKDAVYRASEGGFVRLQPNYHPSPDDFRKDTSGPVLLFDRDQTWYFGNCPRMLPKSLMHLAAKGRGHRVNGTLDGDATALAEWLNTLGPPGVLGSPRHNE